MNPYLIIGFIIALGLAAAGGFSGGDHYRGMKDSIKFQTERDGWSKEQHSIEDAHQKALAQTEADRDTLQRYISNTLGPKYAQLSASNAKLQIKLANQGNDHENLELPSDDHACDWPAGMFDDWKKSNAGTGAGEAAGRIPVSGVDASLWGSGTTGGAVAPPALTKPPVGDGAIPRLRQTP